MTDPILPEPRFAKPPPARPRTKIFVPLKFKVWGALIAVVLLLLCGAYVGALDFVAR